MNRPTLNSARAVFTTHEPLDNRVPIATPENIRFQYDVAGPFHRFIGFVLDIVVVGFALVIVVIGLSLLASMLGRTGEMAMRVVGALAAVLVFLVYWFYGAISEAKFNGKTIGKAMLSIRTVSTDGRPINVTQAGLRNLVRLADCFPLISIPLMFGELDTSSNLYKLPTMLVGLSVMMMNRRYQRLGDIVAGTMVIVEKSGVIGRQTKFADQRVAMLAETIPLSFRASREMAEVLADYVNRRENFSAERRREIARHLGVPLAAEFGLPANTDHDLLLCSLYYKTFVVQIADEPQPASNPWQVSVEDAISDAVLQEFIGGPP